MTPLKTLDEHNAAAQKAYTHRTSEFDRPNGIACPECENELVDPHVYVVLASIPPQMSVECRSCGYKGYRVRYP